MVARSTEGERIHSSREERDDTSLQGFQDLTEILKRLGGFTNSIKKLIFLCNYGIILLFGRKNFNLKAFMHCFRHHASMLSQLWPLQSFTMCPQLSVIFLNTCIKQRIFGVSSEGVFIFIFIDMHIFLFFHIYLFSFNVNILCFEYLNICKFKVGKEIKIVFSKGGLLAHAKAHKSKPFHNLFCYV